LAARAGLKAKSDAVALAPAIVPHFTWGAGLQCPCQLLACNPDSAIDTYLSVFTSRRHGDGNSPDMRSPDVIPFMGRDVSSLKHLE